MNWHDVGPALELLMLQRGLNKTQLSKRMGVSRSHVSKLLAPGRDMRFSTFDAIMKALDFDYDVSFRPKEIEVSFERRNTLMSKVQKQVEYNKETIDFVKHHLEGV